MLFSGDEQVISLFFCSSCGKLRELIVETDSLQKWLDQSSTSESPHKQEELKKWEQKTKIVKTEKRKGENKIKRSIKLLWRVVVNSNNNLLFEKTLKNYLNAILAFIILKCTT